MQAKSKPGRAERNPKKVAAAAGTSQVSSGSLSERSLGLYRGLLLSEELDRRMADWQRQGLLDFYLPAGEWAAALVAIAAAAEPQDWIFPSVRDARIAIHRGLALAHYLAQHLGLDPDPDVDPQASAAGHPQPGSLTDAPHRVASVPGGVAAHLPHAVGAAMAARYRKSPECTLALCSLSAIDAADFHMAAGFATVFRAPVLFVIRGEEGRKAGEALQRAREYDLRAELLADSDPLAIQKKVQETLSHARAGGGPALLELALPEGPEAPRRQLEKSLGTVPEQLVQQIRTEVDQACRKGWDLAHAGRRPALASLIRGVFASETPLLQEELQEVMAQSPRSSEEV